MRKTPWETEAFCDLSQRTANTRFGETQRGGHDSLDIDIGVSQEHSGAHDVVVVGACTGTRQHCLETARHRKVVSSERAVPRGENDSVGLGASTGGNPLHSRHPGFQWPDSVSLALTDCTSTAPPVRTFTVCLAMTLPPLRRSAGAIKKAPVPLRAIGSFCVRRTCIRHERSRGLGSGTV